MGRRKAEINPQQAKNLKHVLSAYEMSQNQLAELAHVSQQMISRVIRGEAGLHKDIAEAIVNACPGFGFRWEWLMGYDDMETESDYEKHCQERAERLLDPVSANMHSILMKLAIKSGYIFSLVTIKEGDVDKDLDKDEGYTSFTLSKKNEKGSRTLSVDELQDIENQIVEFTEFLLWKTLRKPESNDNKIEVIEDFGAWLRGE